MPILKNAKKALRSSKRKAAYNSELKSKMRTAIKVLQETKTQGALSIAYSFIDRAAKRSIIHTNAARRMKHQASRLAK